MQSLIIVIGVTIIVFAIIHLLPGGPARALLGPRATPYRPTTSSSQTATTAPCTCSTRALSETSFRAISASPSLQPERGLAPGRGSPEERPAGGSGLLRRDRDRCAARPAAGGQAQQPVDYVATAAAFIGYSVPVFWLGILLILLFSVRSRWFRGRDRRGQQWGRSSAALRLVLPVATLAIGAIALFSRYMRSSALENLVQDYIRTARAKGVSERAILVKHLLRNSLMPVITLIGLSLPAVLSGAVIVESVFNYPGMGLLFWTAATTHDFPLLLGFTLVIGVATVLGSLLADLLYAVVDPRVRYG